MRTRLNFGINIKTISHEVQEESKRKPKKRVKSCLDYNFVQKEEYEDVFEPWD